MSELRVDNIVSQDGSAAPNYSKGIRVAAGQTMTVEGDYSASGTSTFGGTATFNGPVNIGDINSTGVVTTTALHLGAEGSAVRVTSNTISGPAEMFIDPSAVGDNTGTVRIKGDFIVDGTTTTVNSTTVEIADKVIGVGTTCNTDILTDGAGIGIGSDKTFLYEHNSGTNPSLKSSENLNVPTGKGYQVNQTEVLNATTLGSSVVNSSLTSLGTLGSINATGISTIGNLKISAGIVTAVSGIVTFYGDGQYLTGAGVPGVSTTGTSSFTNLNVSGVSTFAGNINANGNIVGDNSTNISGINSVTATKYFGDGSELSGVASGAADGQDFNTGITNSLTASLTGVGSTVLTLPATSGKQYIVYSIHAANVATGNTEVNVIGAFDFNGGERSYFGYNIPIPTGMAVEMLKQPHILNPSDKIVMRSTDYDRAGSNDIVEVNITYQEKTSSDYFGVGLGTVGIAVTTPVTVHTATTNPSIVESINLANRTDSGSYPVSILVTSGSSDKYLIDNLIVPKYGAIEILDAPKRLEVDDILKIEVDQTSTIDIQVSGKKVVS